MSYEKHNLQYPRHAHYWDYQYEVIFAPKYLHPYEVKKFNLPPYLSREIVQIKSILYTTLIQTSFTDSIYSKRNFIMVPL